MGTSLGYTLLQIYLIPQFFMRHLQFLNSFLQSELSYIWQADQLTISLWLGLSKLIVKDVEITLIPKGTAYSMWFLIQIMWSLQVAPNHALRGKAFLTFVLDKQEISRIYTRHDRVIGLEAPTDTEGIIRKSRSVTQGLRLDRLQVMLLVLSRTIV